MKKPRELTWKIATALDSTNLLSSELLSLKTLHLTSRSPSSFKPFSARFFFMRSTSTAGTGSAPRLTRSFSASQMSTHTVEQYHAPSGNACSSQPINILLRFCYTNFSEYIGLGRSPSSQPCCVLSGIQRDIPSHTEQIATYS